jgi:hypothetical protein
MDWEKMPASKWGLKQLGVLLLLGAYAAGKHLLAIGGSHHGDQPPLAYLLALGTFLCGSTGAALVIHGHHLFDKIQVSERWRQRPPAVPEMITVAAPDEHSGMADIEPPISDASAHLPAVVRGRRHDLRVL